MPLLTFKQGIATEVCQQLEERLAGIERILKDILDKIGETNKENHSLTLLRNTLKDVLEG